MKILVAGGAGMIGSHLCEQLIMEEHSVICMDNLSTGRIENIRRWLDNPLFTFIQHDIVCELPSLPHIDRIYHLASPASPPGCTRLPIETVRIFNTYGPHCDPRDGRLVVNFIVQALRDEALTVYGDGRQTRSLCYVSDLIDGLERAMEANNWPGGVLNLGNPDEHCVLRFA